MSRTSSRSVGSATQRPARQASRAQGAPPAAKRQAPSKSDARPGAVAPAGKPRKPEDKILFQTYFKSVGPRTYASQIKEASNGNPYLVLTEGKRDDKTGDIRKMRLFVFSEDFGPFFRLLHETAQYIKANPVPEEVKQRRRRYWEKRNAEQSQSPAPGTSRR